MIGERNDEVQNVKTELSCQLDMKNMGSLSNFLGLTFRRDEGGAWLIQSGFLQNLLGKFGMSNCKAVSTPVVVGRLKDESKPAEQKEFQNLTGSFLFLASWARLDGSLSVNRLCRKKSASNAAEMVASRCVLFYLRGTKNFGLQFPRDGDILVAYSDSN